MIDIYYNALSEAKTNLEDLVRCDRLQGKNVWLFGVNELMCMCAYYLRKAKISARGIVDNDESKVGKTAYGLNVSKPETSLVPFDDDVRILVASGAGKEMVDQLASMGYRLGKHVFVILDYFLAGHDYHFLDRSGLAPLDIVECRTRWIKMLQRVDCLAQEAGLEYFVGFGTLLGAIRHGGFIPWDDDCDILLPVRDLEGWTETFARDSRYSLYSFFSHDIAFPNLSSTLSDDTLCDMYRIPQLTCGLPIDVFPLIGLPSGVREREKHIEDIKALEGEIWYLCDHPAAQRSAIERIKELMLKYDYDDCEYVTTCVGSFTYRGDIHREVFDSYVSRVFEDIHVRVPVGYDELLENLYGDYMTAPPEEQRVFNHEHLVYAI